MTAISSRIGLLFGHRSGAAQSSIVDGQLIQTVLPATEEPSLHPVLQHAAESIAEIMPNLDPGSLEIAHRLLDQNSGIVATIVADLQELTDPSLPRTPRNGIIDDLQEHAAQMREQNSKIHSQFQDTSQQFPGYSEIQSQFMRSAALLNEEIACLESDAVRADNNLIIDESEQLPVLLHPIFTNGETLDADELFAELPVTVRSSLMAMLTSGLLRAHQKAHDKILRSTFREPQLTRALVYAALQSHAAVSAIKLLGEISGPSELVTAALRGLRDFPKIQENVRCAAKEALETIDSAHSPSNDKVA